MNRLAQLDLFPSAEVVKRAAVTIDLEGQAARFRAAAQSAHNDDAREWFSGAADASAKLHDASARLGTDNAGPAGAAFVFDAHKAGLPVQYIKGALAACETFARALLDAERQS
jgi:hypothetical protein